MLCCVYTFTDFPISIRLTSLTLWQSNDCPSASNATLMNMDKYFMWIHYERLYNHNKAKHNKTVCIFLGICCICVYVFFTIQIRLIQPCATITLLPSRAQISYFMPFNNLSVFVIVHMIGFLMIDYCECVERILVGFLMRCYWNVFLWVLLSISQRWFSWWRLGV